MSRVIDGEAEGDDEHDDGDGIDGETPKVHVADNVDENHAKGEENADDRLDFDDEDGDDDQARGEGDGDVANRFVGDRLVLLIVEPVSAIGENVSILVAGDRSEIGAEGIHRLDVILGFVHLDVVAVNARGDDGGVVVVENDVILVPRTAARTGVREPISEVGRVQRFRVGRSVGVIVIHPRADGSFDDVFVLPESRRSRAKHGIVGKNVN